MNSIEYIRAGMQKNQYASHDTEIWNCPLCSSTDKGKFIKRERGVLDVVKCPECSLIRVNPRLKHPEEVYRGNPTVYSEEYRVVRSGTTPHHRDQNYLRDLALIEKYKPAGNFLDLGSHTGSFLRLARGRGWKLTGVEPSPQLAQLARDWWGLDIVEGFIETLNLPENHFDVITLTDVFEHIVNPREVLAKVKKLLKPDGIIFIKVPNGLFNVIKFKLRKARGVINADDFDSYEHVAHYSNKTLSQMLKVSGFDPVLLTVEPPVQIPVWHKYVGHYYQHRSPWSLAWKTYTARAALYQLSRLEKLITRRVGWLAPNIGIIARHSGPVN